MKRKRNSKKLMPLADRLSLIANVPNRNRVDDIAEAITVTNEAIDGFVAKFRDTDRYRFTYLEILTEVRKWFRGV